MPRLCKVCQHPDREMIDRELIGGSRLSELSAIFRVSEDSLARHRDNHLPEALLQASEAESAASADNLLSQLKNLQDSTLRILRANESIHEDHGVALRAIGEARRNLELLARLTELLGPETEVNVSVAIDARTQQVILRALEDYPEARLAVADALAEIDQ